MASHNTKPAVGDGGSRQELVQRLAELPAVDNRPTTEKQVPRAGRNHQPEAAIQRAVFENLRARGAPGAFFWHRFSGGLRSRTEAARYKGMGAIAGLPDLMILHQGKLYCIELKAEGGRLSEAQERVLIALREAGAMASHAHGLNQALRILEGWQLLRGAAL
jgi:hypothetical protein